MPGSCNNEGEIVIPSSFFSPRSKPENHLRTRYLYEVGSIDFKEVVRRYEDWKKQTVWIGYIKEDVPIIRFFQGKKRGDKRYCKSVKRKIISSIVDFAEKKQNWRYWKVITLTIKISDPTLSYEICRSAWNRLLTHLKYIPAARRKNGIRKRELKILRVFELQKRNVVHVHVLLYGIKYIPQKQLA